MALRCLTLRGESIEAGGLTEDEWGDLKREAITDRNLTIPCCSAEAVFRTSRNGTRYFAHRRRGDCSSKRETEAHRVLKNAALKAARDAGWIACTEASGTSPDGRTWTADVLAEKDGVTLAIEIEWPQQDNDELWRRQRQFQQSGMRAVWLLRQPGFPVSANLPAACVGGDVDEGFEILMPNSLIEQASERKKPWRWEQVASPEQFFEGVIEGRFRFGLPKGANTRLGIQAPWLECPSCARSTRIVTHLEARIGPHRFRTRLDLADEMPRLRKQIRDAVARHPEIGDVRWHQDENWGEPFTANWCAHCGGLIDRLDEHSAYGSEGEPIAWIDLELDTQALRTGRNCGRPSERRCREGRLRCG